MTERHFVRREQPVDITELFEMNKLKKKVPWVERRASIERIFPSIRAGAIDWVQAFSDPHVLGMCLQDILKVDGAQSGRDGPRPSVGQEAGLARLRQLWGDDYSLLPFHEALQALQAARGLSVRGLAAKIGVNYGTVFKYLKGTAVPDVDTMMVVAKAFKRSPDYFWEYRMAVLEAAIERQLMGTPELSVQLYKRLVS